MSCLYISGFSSLSRQRSSRSVHLRYAKSTSILLSIRCRVLRTLQSLQSVTQSPRLSSSPFSLLPIVLTVLALQMASAPASDLFYPSHPSSAPPPSSPSTIFSSSFPTFPLTKLYHPISISKQERGNGKDICRPLGDACSWNMAWGGAALALGVHRLSFCAWWLYFLFLSSLDLLS